VSRHDDATEAAVKADLKALADERDARNAPDAFVADLSDEDRQTAAELASLLEPVSPTASLRDRLMAATEKGRLAHFAAPVAKLLAVDEARAEAMLDAIDEPASWSPNPLPGVTLYHVAGGETVEHAITGFTRIERGGTFPSHTHLGHEYVLVLQGRARDGESGEIFGPGDLSIRPPGTTHDLEVLPGPTLIYLVVLFDGLEVMGLRLEPGNPLI